jgi:hypothetical protein
VPSSSPFFCVLNFSILFSVLLFTFCNLAPNRFKQLCKIF